MRADECLFLVEKRSCSGHHRKDRFRPDSDIARTEHSDVLGLNPSRF
jgi:hypothetical protein